jgi:hypothetical protein
MNKPHDSAQAFSGDGVPSLRLMNCNTFVGCSAMSMSTTHLSRSMLDFTLKLKCYCLLTPHRILLYFLISNFIFTLLFNLLPFILVRIYLTFFFFNLRIYLTLKLTSTFGPYVYFKF